MKSRNLGLDLIRAFAILLVLADHIGYFFPQYVENNPLSVLGFYGVELFFVLSGFLIGKIILRNLAHDFSVTNLKNFYSRRWLRTLPLYYAILVGFIIASNVIYKTTSIHPLHFFFLQNFISNERYFLSPAWSLAIEEWFYLLLPIFFYSLSFIKFSGKKIFLQLSIAIMAISIARLIYVLVFNQDFEVVRVFIPLRFDSLLIGVLLAALRIYYLQWYQKLQNKKVFFSSVGLLLLSVGYYIYEYRIGGIAHSFIFRTFGLTIISLLIALLIPFLETSKGLAKFFARVPLAAKVTTGISLLSYSLYLTHLEVFTFIRVIGERYFSPVVLILPSLIVTFLVSALTYRYIEKPALHFRDTHFK